ncbi:MAG: hypothetical protein JNL11_18745 [Bdellovibrionaceae bacterium]|nr:hypothetical protein [Pseudobdellovibrionaceae bacterium]
MLKLLYFVISIASAQYAVAHSEAFWKSFENDFITMEMDHKLNPQVKSRYPQAVRFLLEGLIGWHPGTTWDQQSLCSLAEFREALYNEPLARKKQVILDEFIQRCHPVYSKNNTLNALKILSQKGSFHHHPFFKYSFLKFPEAHKTRVLWGFKSESKRDLIVIRPGIYANVDEMIAERYLLFLLTELNDFHVVVLENSTSGEHFHNNDKVMIGGAKEAFENLYLIEHIRAHPTLSKLVDKIHLMGISLGANGVLLSSLVNQKKERKYFDKTFLFCPVVDLPGSFLAQMNSGLRPYLMDLWSSQRLEDLQSKKNFQLDSFWGSLFSLTPRWIRGAWAWFEKSYSYKPGWQTYLSKDFYTGDFKNDYDFFNEQTILPEQFYVFATKVDPIVFPEMNYDRLVPKGHQDTLFYKFEDGFHCSFAYTYQWKFLDALFSAMVGRSEEFMSKDSKRYELTVEHHQHLHDNSVSDRPYIRSVEISKLQEGTVELLVYFAVQSDLASGHVKIPLKDLSIDEHYAENEIEAIRNYIKRFIQTKFEIEKDNSKFFIKI